MDTILRFIGGIVAVGGMASVVAYGIFTWLGQKWVENKFAKQLEKLRHEQARELEGLRHEINRLFSRITKIHDREFAVLPSAWEKLLVAQGKAFNLAAPLKESPDFSRMSPTQIDEVLNSSRLPAFRRDEVRAAHDKAAAYFEAMFWIDLAAAKEARADFHNYVTANWIFMTEQLRDGFMGIDEKVREALTALEIGHQLPPGDKMISESYESLKDVDAAIEAVGKMVQKRLHYDEA